MLFKLLNFIRGYVQIKISGKFPERFLNICAYHNIFLWDVIKTEKNNITLCLSKKAYKEVDRIVSKTKVNVEVLKKVGLPFILAKYKKRKVFVIGAVICFVTVFYLLSLVWNVEVVGNEKVPAEEILKTVKQNGIYVGARKRKIDLKDAINNIMLERDDLSWVGIYIKGTKVTISLTERSEKLEAEDTSQPCNVIAKRDGLIQEVIVKQGEACVKKGDNVFKGDLLIKSNVSLEYSEDEMIVHADGEIYAKTWYNIKKRVKKFKLVKEYTGNRYTRSRITILGKAFKIPKLKKMKFESYDVELDFSQASIDKKFIFPLNKTVYVYKEYKIKKIEMNDKEAIKYCINRIEKESSDIIPEDAEILEKYLRYVYDEKDRMYVEMTYECREDIAKKQTVGGSSE